VDVKAKAAKAWPLGCPASAYDGVLQLERRGEAHDVHVFGAQPEPHDARREVGDGERWQSQGGMHPPLHKEVGEEVLAALALAREEHHAMRSQRRFFCAAAAVPQLPNTGLRRERGERDER
jgi:hypothetical protein